MKRILATILFVLSIPTLAWAPTGGAGFGFPTFYLYGGNTLAPLSSGYNFAIGGTDSNSPAYITSQGVYGLNNSSIYDSGGTAGYANSGGSWTSFAAGTGDFKADGSVPMTGTLQMDGNDLAEAGTYGGNSYMGTYYGNEAILKGPLEDVRAYASFASAITSISTTNTTLLIPNTQTVSTDVTVPATMELMFTRNGSLSIDTGVAVTVNGPLDAPPAQVFSGSGNTVLGLGTIDKVPLAWFGFLPASTTTVNLSAWNKAMKATSTNSNALLLPNGTINIGDQLVANPARSLYSDKDSLINVTSPLGAGVDLFLFKNGSNVRIDGFKVDGNADAGTGSISHVIRMHDGSNITISNLVISDIWNSSDTQGSGIFFAGDGGSASGITNATVRDVTIIDYGEGMSAVTGTRIAFVDNTLINGADDAIALHGGQTGAGATSGHHYTITGNRINSNKRHIMLQGYLVDVLVSGNTLHTDNGSQALIEAQNPHASANTSAVPYNVVISNNVLNIAGMSAGLSGILLSAGEDIDINGNQIISANDNSQQKIGVNLTPDVTLDHLDDITIRNNYITNMTQGIQLSGTATPYVPDNISVVGNKFNNFFSQMINIGASPASADAWYFSGNENSKTIGSGTDARIAWASTVGVILDAGDNEWNRGPAAPVSGSWALGQMVINTAPSAGEPVGWMVVTAGSPGTWVSFGQISPSNVEQTFANADTSPSVSAGNMFVMAASPNGATIVNLDDAVAGQAIRVRAVDTGSDFTDGGNFKLNGNWTPSADDTIKLYTPDGTTWYELARSSTDITNLTDVTITSPANNESLMYSTTAGKWVNNTASGSGDMAKATYDTDADDDIDLAAGGTNASLADPNEHAIFGWDDTSNASTLMSLGSGLAYDATTDTLSSSGGSAPLAGTNMSVSGQTVSMVANLDGAYINESTMDASLLGGTIGSDQLAADVARDSELFGGNFSDLAGSITDAQTPDDITILSSAISGNITSAQIAADMARDSELFGGNFSDLAGSATDSQVPDNITISALPAANITGSIQDAQIVAAIARDTELFGGNFSDLAGSITDAQVPDSITVTTITATADSVTQGKVEIATRAETSTGTSQVLAVSPDGLRNLLNTINSIPRPAQWFTPVATDDNIKVWYATGGGVIDSVNCYSTAGTTTILVTNAGSNVLDAGGMACGADTKTTDSTLANTTIAADNLISIDTSAVAGAPTKIFVQVNYHDTD